jgi:ubiquinone/menaquinone biosynthesis C-methylase UbiE
MSFRSILRLTLLIVLIGSVGQTPTALYAASQSEPQDRPTSTPYAGDLSVFETPGRDERLQINRVMNLLHISQGRSVADIGAGSGWFTVRAAKRVGPAGVVYAEEINPAAIDYINQRAQKAHLGNIRTTLGSTTAPRLPDNSVDAIMMLKMYHEIARPVELLQNLRRSLRAGALIGIIDKNGNGSGVDHGVPEETVVREMSAAGFVKVSRYDFVKADDEDYFLIFRQR